MVVWAAVTAPLYVPAGTSPEPGTDVDGRVVRVLASTRQRVGARVVDVLVALLALVTALSPFYTVVLMSDGFRASAGIWVALPVVLVAMAGPVLLRVGAIARWGRTLGQRVAGIRVVRKEDGTSPPGWGRSLRRAALPRSSSSFPLITDPWEQRNDQRLGQCLHDRRADTVVVRAWAPPAPVETGGLAALGPSEVPAAHHGHVRRWEERERRVRVALGSAVGVPAAALAATPFVLAFASGTSSFGGPAFEVTTFYDDDIRFRNAYGGRSETYERTAAEVLDDEAGCLAGATTGAARSALRTAGCEGRIEIAFRTADGVRVSSHVLKFPDAASARAAARQVRAEELRFVPGGTTDPPGGARIGADDSADRYLVVTAAVSPARPDAAERAKNAFLLLHGATVRTIFFL